MRKGQALLVVLLMLGVVLTVGLAVVSRSVTEVSISTTQEESTRALEAAEAGVEKSLAGVGSFGSAASGPQTAVLPNATVNVNNVDMGGTNFYKLPYQLDTGDVATINLTGAAPAQLRLCWGEGSTYPMAEVMLYTTSAGVTNMRKWLLGPSGTGVTNPGTSGSGTACPGDPDSANPQKFDYRYTFSANPAPGDWNGEALVLMRVRLVGNSTPQPVAVNLAGGSLPVQGVDTISAGTSGTTTKKVRVVQVNPDVPFMFDSALFSGTSLTKP